jgi:hypothetical protein
MLTVLVLPESNPAVPRVPSPAALAGITTVPQKLSPLELVAEMLFKCHLFRISIRLTKLLAYQLLIVGSWILTELIKKSMFLPGHSIQEKSGFRYAQPLCLPVCHHISETQ